MTDYEPLPGDVMAKDADRLEVLTVTDAYVTFRLTQAGVPTEYELLRYEFDRKAQGSFAKGAILYRNSQRIHPPIPAMTAPTSTEPTETTEPSKLSGSHATHARLSPSDSKRWVNCTNSIAFQEANAHRLPADRSSYADDGTKAHDYAADLLVSKITAEDIPEPFRDPVTTYTDSVRAHVPDAVLTHLKTCLEDAELGLDPPDKAFFVEEQVDLFYQPEQTGTADFIALSAENGVVTHVYGDDYKHGEGVLVAAQDSTQLAIYVFSAITMLEQAYKFSPDTMVELRIHQPRHREAAEQKPWIITLADLRVFCDEISKQAEVARAAANAVREAIGSTGKDVSCEEIQAAAPMGCFAPGEGDSGACRWCKCKAFCGARLAANTAGMELPMLDGKEVLAAMPDLDKQIKEPEARIAAVSEILGSAGRLMTDEYLVNVLARKKAITSFLSDVEEYLEGRLLAGEDIPGVKLVEGREGNRAWRNEDEAETFLRGQKLKQEERMTMKLKSPAQIEALLKTKLKNTRTKNRFEELITRSPAQKKVAIDSDKRDAVAPAIAALPDLSDEFEV